jgi:hypothetical protein
MGYFSGIDSIYQGETWVGSDVDFDQCVWISFASSHDLWVPIEFDQGVRWFRAGVGLSQSSVEWWESQIGLEKLDSFVTGYLDTAQDNSDNGILHRATTICAYNNGVELAEYEAGMDLSVLASWAGEVIND